MTNSSTGTLHRGTLISATEPRSNDQPSSSPIPHTYVSGPNEPRSLADEPGTWVEVHVAAPIQLVWEIVTDIDAPAAFSDEFQGGTWIGDGRGLGAAFVGRNRHPMIGEWEVTSYVHVFEVGRVFGWATVDSANPGSHWQFTLSPADDEKEDSDDGKRANADDVKGSGTMLRYAMSLGPGPSGITMAITAMPDKEQRILERRLAEHHANMIRTVDGIKQFAEAES